MAENEVYPARILHLFLGMLTIIERKCLSLRHNSN